MTAVCGVWGLSFDVSRGLLLMRRHAGYHVKRNLQLPLGNVAVNGAMLIVLLNFVHPPSRVLQRCRPRAPAEFRGLDVVLWMSPMTRETNIL